MCFVKVKTKGQVTIPTALRRQAGVTIGDVLEAKIERGRITLTPKSLVDSHVAESMEQIKEGQFYGPFDTADQMIASLHEHAKRSVKANKRKRRK